MAKMSELELLQAVLAMAACDGEISRGEKGMIAALAERAGVGGVSLEAMTERALSDSAFREELFSHAHAQARRTMAVLVGAAHVDGQINDGEQKLLYELAGKLGLSAEEYREVHDETLARVRHLRGGAGKDEKS